MTNWRNRIYSNLVTYVDDSDINFITTNEMELVSDKTVLYQMLSNKEIESDLENTEENAETINIQLDVYTTSLNDGYDLADTLIEAMKSMSFTKTFGIELMKNIDTNYKRLVMRFSRVVGSGDEIIKI